MAPPIIWWLLTLPHSGYRNWEAAAQSTGRTGSAPVSRGRAGGQAPGAVSRPSGTPGERLGHAAVWCRVARHVMKRRTRWTIAGTCAARWAMRRTGPVLDTSAATPVRVSVRPRQRPARYRRGHEAGRGSRHCGAGSVAGSAWARRTGDHRPGPRGHTRTVGPCFALLRGVRGSAQSAAWPRVSRCAGMVFARRSTPRLTRWPHQVAHFGPPPGRPATRRPLRRLGDQPDRRPLQGGPGIDGLVAGSPGDWRPTKPRAPDAAGIQAADGSGGKAAGACETRDFQNDR